VLAASTHAADEPRANGGSKMHKPRAAADMDGPVKGEPTSGLHRAKGAAQGSPAVRSLALLISCLLHGWMGRVCSCGCGCTFRRAAAHVLDRRLAEPKHAAAAAAAT
jgi:hypothetical protein